MPLSTVLNCLSTIAVGILELIRLNVTKKIRKGN